MTRFPMLSKFWAANSYTASTYPAWVRLRYFSAILNMGLGIIPQLDARERELIAASEQEIAQLYTVQAASSTESCHR